MKNFEKVKYIEIVLENCEVIIINIEHIKFLSFSGITFNDFFYLNRGICKLATNMVRIYCIFCDHVFIVFVFRVSKKAVAGINRLDSKCGKVSGAEVVILNGYAVAVSLILSAVDLGLDVGDHDRASVAHLVTHGFGTVAELDSVAVHLVVAAVEYNLADPVSG